MDDTTNGGTTTELRLQDVARFLDDANIIIHSLDGSIRYWSSGCERLYGYTRSQAIGQIVQHLLATELDGIKVEVSGGKVTLNGRVKYLARAHHSGTRCLVSSRRHSG